MSDTLPPMRVLPEAGARLRWLAGTQERLAEWLAEWLAERLAAWLAIQKAAAYACAPELELVASPTN